VKQSSLAFSERLPRLRAGALQRGRHACVPERLAAHICFNKDKHFGVQARTFQVFAMTEWKIGFVL